MFMNPLHSGFVAHPDGGGDGGGGESPTPDFDEPVAAQPATAAQRVTLNSELYVDTSAAGGAATQGNGTYAVFQSPSLKTAAPPKQTTSSVIGGQRTLDIGAYAVFQSPSSQPAKATTAPTAPTVADQGTYAVFQSPGTVRVEAPQVNGDYEYEARPRPPAVSPTAGQGRYTVPSPVADQGHYDVPTTVADQGHYQLFRSPASPREGLKQLVQCEGATDA
jgi:hypothetical protein